VLSDFVESYFHGNLVCHATTLQQAGLISQEAIVDTNPQTQVMIGSRSTARPHADPITDLAVLFPTHELMTDDSEGPEERVLCVTSSEEAEEGRLRDQIQLGRSMRTRSGGI
jgi:hypothetical protein